MATNKHSRVVVYLLCCLHSWTVGCTVRPRVLPCKHRIILACTIVLYFVFSSVLFPRTILKLFRYQIGPRFGSCFTETCSLQAKKLWDLICKLKNKYLCFCFFTAKSESIRSRWMLRISRTTVFTHEQHSTSRDGRWQNLFARHIWRHRMSPSPRVSR